jgi:hypothetical protein
MSQNTSADHTHLQAALGVAHLLLAFEMSCLVAWDTATMQACRMIATGWW